MLQVTGETGAVNCCVVPTAMGALLGEIEGAGSTVTIAFTSAEGSARDCAVIVICAGRLPGVLDGAVYVAVLVDAPVAIDPKPKLKFVLPAINQVTPVFDTPVTVAVNTCVPLVSTVAAVGEIDILTGVTLIVAVAVGDLELVSNAEPAVMVTGVMAEAGAV
jgi:hypothetical protein